MYQTTFIQRREGWEFQRIRRNITNQYGNEGVGGGGLLAKLPRVRPIEHCWLHKTNALAYVPVTGQPLIDVVIRPVDLTNSRYLEISEDFQDANARTSPLVLGPSGPSPLPSVSCRTLTSVPVPSNQEGLPG